MILVTWKKNEHRNRFDLLTWTHVQQFVPSVLKQKSQPSSNRHQSTSQTSVMPCLSILHTGHSSISQCDFSQLKDIWCWFVSNARHFDVDSLRNSRFFSALESPFYTKSVTSTYWDECFEHLECLGRGSFRWSESINLSRLREREEKIMEMKQFEAAWIALRLIVVLGL